MTLGNVQMENMNINNKYRKTASKALVCVLRRAQMEQRVTCAMLPAIKMLEVDPRRALFCILPQGRQGDAALHIHSVLLQAFCYEHRINIIKVDSADKLGVLLSGGTAGPRLDCSCVLVHRPWATDQPALLSAQEQELTRYCDSTADAYPPPVIQLPES